MNDPQNLPSPPATPASSMGAAELDAFASKSAAAFQGARALEILEEIVGPDVLEYRDPRKAAVFAADVLRMAALASIEGNPDFMKSAANVLRLQARSHGVQIARNVEDKFGERIAAVMSLFRDLLPLFL